MPTLEDFARMYIKEGNGESFFPPRGAHYTLPRQTWLSVAVVLWAIRHNLSMVLCLGWNCKNGQALDAELVAQEQLVVELARRAGGGAGSFHSSSSASAREYSPSSSLDSLG